MATKISKGYYVPDICPCAKLHYDPIRRFCPHICEFERCRFAQVGPENKFLHSDPIFAKKAQIVGRFSTELKKFRLKTGFNMGGFVSKHPLND